MAAKITVTHDGAADEKSTSPRPGARFAAAAEHGAAREDVRH